MMYSQPHRGFTFIETLVAITILVFAIVAPFYAVRQAMKATFIARDELVATSLAQEAAEYVRSVRDSNYLYNYKNPSTPRTWLYGLDGTGGTPDCYTTNKCTIDPSASTPIVRYTSAAIVPALYVSSSKIYNQASNGTATRFKRTVTLTSINANETQVTVTVTWINHIAYTVTVTDVITNWL